MPHREPRYPSAPAKAPQAPPDSVPVHFMDAMLFTVCRISGAGIRLKTSVLGKVTCPACLKKMKAA
ncbi:MAG: hypothetical protein LAE24_07725 [Candidatus Contendobacter sp.]|nr:hypothetical protein [Candidatus Contendobacter sp.]